MLLRPSTPAAAFAGLDAAWGAHIRNHVPKTGARSFSDKTFIIVHAKAVVPALLDVFAVGLGVHLQKKQSKQRPRTLMLNRRDTNVLRAEDSYRRSRWNIIIGIGSIEWSVIEIYLTQSILQPDNQASSAL